MSYKELSKFLTDVKPWTRWYWDDEDGTPSVWVEGVGFVEVVERFNNTYYDSYGYPDGGQVYMIFKIAGRFYKIEGYGSSYDSVVFDKDAELVEVTQNVKTVYVYEEK